MPYNFKKLGAFAQLAEYDELTAEYENFAESELLHTTDGPVSSFTAISRAMEYTANADKYKRFFGEYTHEDMANCLSIALDKLAATGERASTEFSHCIN